MGKASNRISLSGKRALTDPGFEEVEDKIDNFEEWKFLIYVVADLHPTIITGGELKKFHYREKIIDWCRRTTAAGEWVIMGNIYIVRLKH